MVCFSGLRSNLFVRILAVLQLGLQVSTATVGVLGLLSAYTDRNASDKGNGGGDGHHCECVLKTRPASCELIDVPGTKEDVTLWDPLFLVVCFWTVCLSVLSVARDLRYGTSRLMNAALFFLTGSMLVGLGNHYDRFEPEIFGYVSSIFALVLLASVPVCGRYRESQGLDEESRLTDNDEFGQAHGVFSSLND